MEGWVGELSGHNDYFLSMTGLSKLPTLSFILLCKTVKVF